MPKREMPFVIYRQRPSGSTVAPRGWQGWCQVAIWLAVPVPALIWFFDLVAFYGAQDGSVGAILMAIVLLALWVIAGIWWVHAHAEVVDLGEPRKRPQIVAQRRRKNP
jgi:hypothetical protein